jgi:hypothetical protein
MEHPTVAEPGTDGGQEKELVDATMGPLTTDTNDEPTDCTVEAGAKNASKDQEPLAVSVTDTVMSLAPFRTQANAAFTGSEDVLDAVALNASRDAEVPAVFPNASFMLMSQDAD